MKLPTGTELGNLFVSCEGLCFSLWPTNQRSRHNIQLSARDLIGQTKQVLWGDGQWEEMTRTRLGRWETMDQWEASGGKGPSELSRFEPVCKWLGYEVLVITKNIAKVLLWHVFWDFLLLAKKELFTLNTSGPQILSPNNTQTARAAQRINFY